MPRSAVGRMGHSGNIRTYSGETVRVSYRPVFVGGLNAWRIERIEERTLTGKFHHLHEAEAAIRQLSQSGRSGRASSGSEVEG